MKAKVIALVGERDLAKPAHAGIEASLALQQRDRDPALAFRWVSTSSLTAGKAGDALKDVSGIWCVPGSPYESTAGALAAIRFAREQHRPFLGTCGGFQHALMEFCATMLRRNAVHQELAGDAPDPLIIKLSCSLAGARSRVIAPAGSWYATTVGADESVEEFNCNYGLSPSFEPFFAGSGLEFVARDDGGQVRAFRLARHPFFVGTLFQPERRALAGSLHPLVQAFLNHP
jgi:CTP synthase (UTP-ammonia lyase)